MSKKGKGVVMGSMIPYAYGGYKDAKAQFKYQTLIQDYQDLQRESFIMKSKLEAAKQRKLTLAAEVRFLRRRYKLLVKTRTVNSSQEQKLVRPPNSLGRTKILKERNFSGKETTPQRLLPISELKPKKKRNIIKKVVLHNAPASAVHDQHHNQILPVEKEATWPNSIPLFGLSHKGRTNTKKETLAPNSTSILDLNIKETVYGSNDAALRKSIVAFDLNQVSSCVSGKEGPLPSRVPIFDLNEISTTDEEILNNHEALKSEDAKKNLFRANDELHNDLKLSICRNSGESSSLAGKRKISWKDPVALRV